ncbi:MAG: galactokinase [Trueperaceae bacterium]|nr:galactokinase [Trueperaceae bacterium]
MSAADKHFVFLNTIYSQQVAGQRERYQQALQLFRSLYGEGEVHIFRAPGRVNLIGEHTDYNHGFVMPVALDRDTVVLARARADSQLHLSNVEAEFEICQFEITENIPLAPNNHWSNYARGVAQHLKHRLSRPIKGADLLVVAEAPWGVPRGAGLSSSSSLTIAIMLALTELNGWTGSTAEQVQLASDAEWYVGTRGGIMDHYISLEGQKNHALFLDCRPVAGSYQSQPIPLSEGYDLLIINSGVKHQNVGGGYNWRVAACRAGVGLLKAQFPEITHLRDVQSVPWEVLEPHLPEKQLVSELTAQGTDLDDIPTLVPEAVLEVRAKCRHVHSENERVQGAIEAMYQGNVTRLGQLLSAAHLSARDDYDISCAELELLQSFLQKQEAVLGSRLTGAGWGGCMVALSKRESSQELARAVQAYYHEATGIVAETFVCQASQGAGLLTTLTV